MNRQGYLNNDKLEQEQLESLHALIEDATRGTVLWLQDNPSAEERVHVLAIQGLLADLARIVERRMERRKLPKDEQEYSETVSDVLSRLEKAREVRGTIVGNGLARLAERLPKKLPGSKPKPKLPEPVHTVNTGFTVTQAPAPPRSVGGLGLTHYEPRPIRMPSRPDDFPGELWPRAVVALSKLIERFPDQKHLTELCEHVVPEMTPLYCDAVEMGKIKAGSVLDDRSGMEELLRLLLVANDPGPSSWGLSNQAWDILQKVKAATWGKLAEAIEEVQTEMQQNGTGEARFRTNASQMESSRAQSSANSAQDVESESTDAAPAKEAPASTKRPRLSATINCPSAASRMEAYLQSKGISQTDFASSVNTTDRTLRAFRRTGKVRRDIFDAIARAMSITREELLKQE
jgi:hypothetical protein